MVRGSGRWSPYDTSHKPEVFVDGQGQAFVLTGAHTWSIFQDYEQETPVASGYLSGIGALGHNFTRGWFWEDDYYSPLPYVQISGGEYRLSAPYNSAYTSRLQSVLNTANTSHDMFMSVMLFQGWSMNDRDGGRVPDPWPRNPYNFDNHNEPLISNKQGDSLHARLAQPQQLSYVDFVVGALCSRPNVLFEISNQSIYQSVGINASSNWQQQIANRVSSGCSQRLIWASCPPIGATDALETAANAEMFDMSNVDIVSPCSPGSSGGIYFTDPPVADGRKVVIADSDHINVLNTNYK